MNALDGFSTTAALWLAVVGSGIYHGINPGMGWPLAVSAGLMGRGQANNSGFRDLFAALGSLAIGHFLAMAGILLPFAAMAVLVEWQREIQIGAALAVIAMGVYLYFNRRHPRFLARIRPTQLALWSFAVAMAHGAGLMLVPIYLGLCRMQDFEAGHAAAATSLMAGNIGMATFVALVHALAMIASGGLIACAVYSSLGPQFIARSWFKLDAIWTASLVLVGVVALGSVWVGR